MSGIVAIVLAYFFYDVATARIDGFLFGEGVTFQTDSAMRTLTAGGLFGMGIVIGTDRHDVDIGRFGDMMPIGGAPRDAVAVADRAKFVGVDVADCGDFAAGSGGVAAQMLFAHAQSDHARAQGFHAVASGVRSVLSVVK